MCYINSCWHSSDIKCQNWPWGQILTLFFFTIHHLAQKYIYIAFINVKSKSYDLLHPSMTYFKLMLWSLLIFLGSSICHKENVPNPINSSMLNSRLVLIFFLTDYPLSLKSMSYYGKKERKKKDWVANSFHVGSLTIHKISKAKYTSNYTHTHKIKEWGALNAYTKTQVE